MYTQLTAIGGKEKKVCWLNRLSFNFNSQNNHHGLPRSNTITQIHRNEGWMNMPHNRLICQCIHSKIKPFSVQAPLDALQTDDFVRRHTLTCLYFNTDVDGWGWWESTWAEINSKSLTISEFVCSLQIASLFCPGCLACLKCFVIQLVKSRWKSSCENRAKYR